MEMTNRCSHPLTTSRPVPIEWHDADGTGTRIPEAVLHTCVNCRASFYQEEAWGRAQIPVVPPAAPIPTEQ